MIHAAWHESKRLRVTRLRGGEVIHSAARTFTPFFFNVEHQLCTSCRPVPSRGEKRPHTIWTVLSLFRRECQQEGLKRLPRQSLHTTLHKLDINSVQKRYQPNSNMLVLQ